MADKRRNLHLDKNISQIYYRNVKPAFNPENALLYKTYI